jgi:hypothetical protein
MLQIDKTTKGFDEHGGILSATSIMDRAVSVMLVAKHGDHWMTTSARRKDAEIDRAGTSFDFIFGFVDMIAIRDVTHFIRFGNA